MDNAECLLPSGFLAAITEAAIKRPGRPDMCLIYSECPASAAGMFTTNNVKAAPVLLCMKKIRAGSGRAIVVNSGNANACTGKQGMIDANETSKLISAGLGIPDAQVYVSSTGVIGVPMPMERMRTGATSLIEGIGKAGLRELALAIMTTDTFPKYTSREIEISGHTGRISAICKGAGMIAPNMATMLCYVMTDIAVEKSALKSALKNAVETSFNRITIDGDRSTNDTVIALANGMAKNKPVMRGTRDYKKFSSSIDEVLYGMSCLIVQDGEGATKVIEVEVYGARTAAEAKRGAMAIANSLLVKTAIYGRDPNWGRIMAALGASGIKINESKTDIYINEIPAVKSGMSAGAEEGIREKLSAKEITIRVVLNSGKSNCRVLTCDLTEGYIKINAEYTT